MKLSKVFSIIAIAVMLIATLSNVALAFNPAGINANTNAAGMNSVKNIGGRVVGFIQVGGSIIAIVVLVVLGIKYMMGSAEEKAEYKKTMVPYVIGAIIVFAASQIAGIIFSVAGGIAK